MTRVMASGVFDIIHPGHISYLRQAKSYGDELVVVVASDETVRREKHEPITPEDMRAKIVGELKPVDRAVVGHSGGSIFDIVREIKPDVIVLGYDQHFDEAKLSRDLESNGLRGIKVVRATETADDLNATRRIVAKIRNMGGAN
ncbi:FAD synthase [Candidatus Methanomethylophilus sp. 1R26]|uniref:adenylyltransferase/cytidyltransferase family protein n=1 Tax=Candidatus Methanomethylophilus sp. 1R26 TaxID=1769296 RepID=UPI00073680D0|nr:adenylyltransferase/cytidyltransferase family protein [Candidatus Methanomethylophilus sp. 1R26]KUE73967.1 FAD synthase [Candidatus Methanomethylophilus sp. 1R26]MCI2093093.1 FAD synthase [Methanomethylophilus sp.]TQS79064.1 MAG: FAD synthase [Methanomethylophilus alvi]